MCRSCLHYTLASFAWKGMPWQLCWLAGAANDKLQTHGGKQNEVTRKFQGEMVQQELS